MEDVSPAMLDAIVLDHLLFSGQLKKACSFCAQRGIEKTKDELASQYIFTAEREQLRELIEAGDIGAVFDLLETIDWSLMLQCRRVFTRLKTIQILSEMQQTASEDSEAAMDHAVDRVTTEIGPIFASDPELEGELQTAVLYVAGAVSYDLRTMQNEVAADLNVCILSHFGHASVSRLEYILSTALSATSLRQKLIDSLSAVECSSC